MISQHHRLTRSDCLSLIPNASSIAAAAVPDCPDGAVLPKVCLKARYRVVDRLDRGGFGRTFWAIDESNSRQSPCVIKQLRLNHSYPGLPPQTREQFDHAALQLSELGNHAQIPHLLDSFEQDGRHYLVQEWIDGQSLEQELAESSGFHEAEIWQLLRELLPVIQFIHDRQIIHRDLKPANIIRRRSDQHLVLVDFGSAKHLDQAQSIDPETLTGSAEYAAPEQIRGRAVFASDLYSLGVTCLYLLTQLPPFDLYEEGENEWKWQAALTQPLSPGLKHILTKLLQPTLRQRYQSAAEVLADLEARAIGAGGAWARPNPAIASPLVSSPECSAARSAARCNPSSATIAAIHTVQAHRTTGSATLYIPHQGWYSLEPKTKNSDLAQSDPGKTVNRGLGSRFSATIDRIQQRLAIAVPNAGARKMKSRRHSWQSSQVTIQDSVELIFSSLLLFVLTCIGSMTLICIFFEMERPATSTTPVSPEVQSPSPLFSSRDR